MDNVKTAQAIYNTLKVLGSMSKDLDALWQVASEAATSYTVKQAIVLAAYAKLIEEMPKGVLDELENLKNAEGSGCGCPIKDESVESLLRKIVDGAPEDFGGQDAHGKS